MGTSAQSGPEPTPSTSNKWWKLFKSSKEKSLSKDFKDSHSTKGRSQTEIDQSGGVFGVSLQVSLRYASVAISQVGPDKKARIYGHIPVVVAKAGRYLKENGSSTPGVFRVSGSNKRIKELEQIFDTPPEYGKDLTWESYSVHDAASAFRRYLNVLPEPIIPYELYRAFHDARPVCEPGQTPSEAEVAAATERYRSLINSLPPASQHLFFYTLDLLSVFHRKSSENLMPASNLALIFQPGLLRHQSPTSGTTAFSAEDRDGARHQMEADASEHKRSQEVLVFLIEHQSSFELGLPPKAVQQKDSSTLQRANSSASDTGRKWKRKSLDTRRSSSHTGKARSVTPSAHWSPGSEPPDTVHEEEAAPVRASSPAPLSENVERKDRQWSPPWKNRRSMDIKRSPGFP